MALNPLPILLSRRAGKLRWYSRWPEWRSFTRENLTFTAARADGQGLVAAFTDYSDILSAELDLTGRRIRLCLLASLHGAQTKVN